MVRSSTEIMSTAPYHGLPSDWDELKAFSDGFTPSGTFRSPYTFLVDFDGTYYYACNAFQVVYGGPDIGETGTGAGGVDGSDSEAVFTAVRNYLNANGGGKLCIGKGIYTISDFNVISGSSSGLIEVQGSGPATQLRVPNGGTGFYFEGASAFGYGGPYHCILRDFVLTTASGNAMDYGIKAKNWFDLSVENVLIFYANEAGIYAEDCADIHLNNVYVEGCGGIEYGGETPLQGKGVWLRGSKDCFLSQVYSDTNYYGFLVDSSTGYYPMNLYLSLCEATLCKAKGVSISWADGIDLSQIHIEGCDSDGLFLNDSLRVKFRGGVIKGNVGNGANIVSTARSLLESEISIKDAVINSNNGNGIGIYSQNGYQITQLSLLGNTIINSGAAAKETGANNNRAGIDINDDTAEGSLVYHTRISDNKIGNQNGLSAIQKYGLRMQSHADYASILDNDFFSNTAEPVAIVGTHNRYRGNSGFVTETKGTSTGTGEQQAIEHGLFYTPKMINLWDISTGAAPYQSAAPDGTYIYVTAGDGKMWGYHLSASQML